MSRLIVKKNKSVYSETSKKREIKKKIKRTQSSQKNIEAHGTFNDGSQKKNNKCHRLLMLFFLQE